VPQPLGRVDAVTDSAKPTPDSQISESLDELETLVSQSGCAFLLGAGCSRCAGLPLTLELSGKVEDSDKIEERTKSILTAVKRAFGGAQISTIEDYLSEIVDHLSVDETAR
jgi:hypothetical protein